MAGVCRDCGKAMKGGRCPHCGYVERPAKGGDQPPYPGPARPGKEQAPEKKRKGSR